MAKHITEHPGNTGAAPRVFSRIVYLRSHGANFSQHVIEGLDFRVLFFQSLELSIKLFPPLHSLLGVFGRDIWLRAAKRRRAKAIPHPRHQHTVVDLDLLTGELVDALKVALEPIVQFRLQPEQAVDAELLVSPGTEVLAEARGHPARALTRLKRREVVE